MEKSDQAVSMVDKLRSLATKDRDKAREKLRQKQLQSGEGKKKGMARPPRSEAWSQLKARKAKRQERKGKKKLKTDHQQEQKKQGKEQTHGKRGRADEEAQDDWDELGKDLRLIKKLKKGKVTALD
nr:hypothetical protein BaRGS_015402 [Batillaria attramentaria]